MTKMFIFDPPYLRREAGKIDYWGIGMLVRRRSGALQYCSTKDRKRTCSPSQSIVILSIVSAVTLACSVYHELTTEHPIIDCALFKERSYATGVF